MRRLLAVVTLVGAALLLLEVSPGAAKGGGISPPVQASVTDQNLAIIVNHANTVDDLTLKELRTVFLGERSHWPNGRRITLVMMDPGEPERTAVLRDICRMNETEFSRHFLQGLFTGEVFVSPKTLSSPTGVRKFVFNVPGAIGYVRASDVDGTVKVIRINGHAVDDSDYPLRIEARASK
jgi:ABC-type phosphate transport system substrate-binding protein